MISKTAQKSQKRARRHRRIRGQIFGTSDRPRISVYRSNNYLYAQLIDDEKAVTLVSSSDLSLKNTKGSLAEKAETVGADLAKKASEKKIKEVVFDRGGFDYSGRIKVLAEAARKGGLIF